MYFIQTIDFRQETHMFYSYNMECIIINGILKPNSLFLNHIKKENQMY